MTNAILPYRSRPLPAAWKPISRRSTAFRILTQEQETRACAAACATRAIWKPRASWCVSHLRVVVAIARGYMGYGLPQADLIQEGNIGLMKAVKRFDPERGVRLVSFAVHWIRAEIHEFILRNWRIVKVATTKAQRKLFFNLRSMKQGLGTLGRDEVKAMAQAARRQARGSRRDGNAPGRPGRRARAAERRRRGQLTRRSPTSPTADAEPGRVLEQEQTEQLRSAGPEAGAGEPGPAQPPHHRSALAARRTDPATLHDLADEFGVSAERIRQIESKALKKMKGVIARA